MTTEKEVKAVDLDAAAVLSDLEKVEPKALDEAVDFVPAAGGSAVDPVADRLQQTAAMLEMSISVVFALVAVRAGDHWALKEGEAAAVAEPAAAVLEKYLPDIEIGCEFALVMAVGGVVLPRIVKSKQMQGVEPKGEPKAEPKAEPKKERLLNDSLPVVDGVVQMVHPLKGLD